MSESNILSDELYNVFKKHRKFLKENNALGFTLAITDALRRVIDKKENMSKSGKIVRVYSLTDIGKSLLDKHFNFCDKCKVYWDKEHSCI